MAQIHFLTNPTRCSWLCFLKLWRRNLLFFYLRAGCIFDDWHILSISPSIYDSSWGDVKALHPLVDPLPLTLPPTSSPFHQILTPSYVLSLNPPPYDICQATLREKQLYVGVGSMGLESDKPGLVSGFNLHWPWIFGHVVQSVPATMFLCVPSLCNIPNSQCCFATKSMRCKMLITQKELNQWYFFFLSFLQVYKFLSSGLRGGLAAPSVIFGIRHHGWVMVVWPWASHYTSAVSPL